MSSHTYFTLRRELIQNARKLSQALRKKNQALIEKLTVQVNMLIARLCKVMSSFELRRLLASAGLIMAINMAPTETSAQSFSPPVSDPFGLSEIRMGAWIEFADLDGDGDFDGIAGGGDEYSYGVIFYFENIGNAEQAAFIPPVENPFGIDAGIDEVILPAAVDIDADGDLDLMLASYYGMLFLENTGTSTQPSFEAPVADPFGITAVSYMFSPNFVDLDNDGDLDLLVGSNYEDEYTYEGSIYYYENTGSATDPQFAAPIQNPFGLSDVGYYAAFPALADLDNDGDLDLLVGDFYEYYSGNYYSTIRYYENVGDVESPQFAEAVLNPFGLSGGYYLSYPSFVDIDDDGDMDLFIGEVSQSNYENGRFVYYENLGVSSIDGVIDINLFDIFPNPAVDQINIKSDLNIVSIELVDADGRVIDFDTNERTIDVGHLAPGLFTLRVRDSEGKAYVKPFVKVK